MYLKLLDLANAKRKKKCMLLFFLFLRGGGGGGGEVEWISLFDYEFDVERQQLLLLKS